jgi:hypothetical protein
MTHSFRAAAILLSGLAVAACSGTAAVNQAAADAAAARAQASAASAAKLAAARQAALRKAAAVAAEPRVSITRESDSDGSLVIVAIFRGTVRYVLHDGSEDPAAPAGLLKARYYVSSDERPALLAAFNGGFKMAAAAGGYEQEGHVLYPLRDGLASLVIDRSGHARIVVWPAAGTDAYSVRQNLQPLVLDGRPTAASSDWGLWGATLGGGEYVARSAVGENAAGDLIYAGSMSATPYDLARSLARAGARIGMELDINPAWVQLDVARHPGGELHATVYGQNRPADQYLDGWTRDFFTVLG